MSDPNETKPTEPRREPPPVAPVPQQVRVQKEQAEKQAAAEEETDPDTAAEKETD